MLKELMTSVRATLVTVFLLGLVYPAGITAAAQVLFPAQANGSLAKDDRGRVVGSALIGQAFTQAGYFQSRPSAAGNGYDAAASSGSNLGPSSKKLRDRVVGDVQRLQDGQPGVLVPDDLVTASGSGLDPHITPQAARFQVGRVAKARNVSTERVAALVESHVEGRWLGVLGEDRVNVLLLNLALDNQFGAVAPPTPAAP